MQLNVKIDVENLVEKCFIFITMFNLFYHQILKRVMFGESLNVIISGIVIALFFYKNYRRIPLLTVVIYLVISIITLLNVFVFQIEEAFNILPQYLLFTVPAMFAGCTIDFYKNERFIQCISVIYVISNFIFILSVASRRSNMATSGIDHMAFAYQALPAVLILLYHFKKNHNVFNGIMAALALIYIVACGTRGPIICIVVFGLLIFLKDLRKFDTKKIAMIMLAIIGSVGVIINWFNIIKLLIPIFDKYRLSTRILYSLITTSDNSFSSGRDSIYKIILNNINQHAIFGTGIMSDRMLLNGMWSHNVILEVLNDFGIPIGGTLIVFLVVLIIRRVRNLKNREFLNIIIIYFSCTIIKLMLSATFLTEFNLYFFIGLCCSDMDMLTSDKTCDQRKIVPN